MPFLYSQTVLSGDVWTVISMAIDLNNVTLEFVKSHDVDLGKEESLAKLDFIRSRLCYDAFSDQSKETDLVSHEILVFDTRFKGKILLFCLTIKTKGSIDSLWVLDCRQCLLCP